ncbi:MAG: histidine phosphatase family protein [Thermoguttaceae bacterium]|nr:histidine phosphatase family protein [Thermoguttaceae bacterium]MDW8077592.1 histidine phosphatase family protein [Thermoguttaceae bacterium]
MDALPGSFHTLYLVRHGESVYNAEGRVQGQSDIPLSPHGERQSEAVAQALASVPVTAVYSSPLLRARQTAERIAAVHGLPIFFDDRLKELHAGIFQGRLRSELPVLFPEEYAAWSSGDPYYVIPGGQSRYQVRQRGKEVLEEIAARHTGHTVVVGHGALFRFALAALLGHEGVAELPPLANGSITVLGYEGDGRFRILAYNQVDHLRHLGPSSLGDL